MKIELYSIYNQIFIYMGHKIKDFETAANKKGYHIEQIKSDDMRNVVSMYGSPKKKQTVANIRWNSIGHCFSRTGARLAEYDLTLSPQP
jgi:hypothetical protein